MPPYLTQKTFTKPSLTRRRAVTKGLMALSLPVPPLLGGCAGMARGTDFSLPNGAGARDFPSAIEAKPYPLVRLRYPARITPAAEAPFVAAYASHPVGSATEQVAPHIAEQVALPAISKSIYFAHELYFAFQQALPEKSVITDPYQIHMSSDNQLIGQNLSTTATPPALIDVEVFAYSHPDPEQIMSTEINTTGDLFGPLISVHRRSTFDRRHLLIAPAPMVDLASDESPLVITFFNQGPVNENQRPSRKTSWPPSIGQPYAFDLRSIELPSNSIKDATWKLDDRRVVANEMAELTESVVSLIAQHSENEFRAFEQYLKAEYDPRYAANTPFFELLNEVVKVERDFLAAKSRKMYDAIVKGKFGRDFRRLAVAELDMLDQRRSLAMRQNIAMLGSFALAGVGAFGAAQGVSPQQMGLFSRTNQLSSTIQDAAEQSRNVGESFSASFDAAYDEVFRFSFTIFRIEEEILISDLRKLKKRLKDAYSKQIA